MPKAFGRTLRQWEKKRKHGDSVLGAQKKRVIIRNSTSRGGALKRQEREKGDEEDMFEGSWLVT